MEQRYRRPHGLPKFQTQKMLMDAWLTSARNNTRVEKGRSGSLWFADRVLYSRYARYPIARVMAWTRHSSALSVVLINDSYVFDDLYKRNMNMVQYLLKKWGAHVFSVYVTDLFLDEIPEIERGLIGRRNALVAKAIGTDVKTRNEMKVLLAQANKATKAVDDFAELYYMEPPKMPRYNIASTANKIGYDLAKAAVKAMREDSSES